ncbi:MAG: PD-(D/E)XK nuclease family protein [Terriglobia bacterium]|jgi:hypothetical protein
MAKVFRTIDHKTKEFFARKRTEGLLQALPPGVVEYGEKWVQSRPLLVPKHVSPCFVRGKIDTVLKLDDGSWAVVDFKTGERKSEHMSLYSRQLHAYAIALENAAPGMLELRPIKKLGLLVFEPDAFRNAPLGPAALLGSMTWIEIPRDDEGFLAFLSEVLDVLESTEPPAGSPTCEWCNYRAKARQTGL